MDDVKVDAQSAAVAAMSADWALIDALVGGTAAMRAAGKKYLPQWPSEPDDSYKARLSTAVLFSAFKHTSEILAAKPLARPIPITDVSETVESLMSNVDMYGNDIQGFCAQLMLACLQPGLVGVLVDYPPAPNVRTKEQERTAGLRPYFTRYPAPSILGWRAARNADGQFLTQIRLAETVTEPDGDFGEKPVKQVRVLYPGRWEIWREARTQQGNTNWEIFEQGLTTLSAIPFVFFYGLRQDFGISKSPLLDLAYMNVEHWQSSSDQQTILHAARVPILFGKGFSETDKIVIGASSAVMTNNEKADLAYVEHTGAAIEAGRQSILDLEDRMRQTGAELLVQRPATVTATQVVSEGEGSRSILQRIVEEFEDSLEQCLKFMGEWLGEKSKPKVEMYKDFGSANLSEKHGDLLLRAVDSGVVSNETGFDQLKRMDVVAPDLDWEDEKLKLAKQKSAEPTDA